MAGVDDDEDDKGVFPLAVLPVLPVPPAPPVLPVPPVPHASDDVFPHSTTACQEWEEKCERKLRRAPRSAAF